VVPEGRSSRYSLAILKYCKLVRFAKSRIVMRNYPELFCSISRSIDFCIYLDCIPGNVHRYLLELSRSLFVERNTLTEICGGTEAWAPLLFANVPIGIMVLGRGAAGDF
jgi:hypothetical protein